LASGLNGRKKRVDRLGRALRDERCPRCSDAVVIVVGGKLRSVMRGGVELTEQEARAFVAEEVGDRCPLCGDAGAAEIRVGARRNRVW
jgi:hypothetical protein